MNLPAGARLGAYEIQSAIGAGGMGEVHCAQADGDRRMSRKARTLIGNRDHDVFINAASAWEITTKARLGKLPGAVEVAADVARWIASQAFSNLDITVLHAQRAGRLPGEHRDPFDRMLAAQAQLENVPIVTDDEVFDGYGVNRIW